MERAVSLVGLGAIVVLGFVAVSMVAAAVVFRAEGDAAVASLLGAALLAAGAGCHAYVFAFLGEWRR